MGIKRPRKWKYLESEGKLEIRDIVTGELVLESDFNTLPETSKTACGWFGHKQFMGDALNGKDGLEGAKERLQWLKDGCPKKEKKSRKSEKDIKADTVRGLMESGVLSEKDGEDAIAVIYAG